MKKKQKGSKKCVAYIRFGNPPEKKQLAKKPIFPESYYEWTNFISTPLKAKGILFNLIK